MTSTRRAETEPLDLPQATEQLLEECRMVLPGIQALFGFQLIAVLSSGFPGLAGNLKALHLAATILTSIAIALVMAPAAFHRQASPHAVSEALLKISTRLLLAGMVPLAVGICTDLYVVSHVVVGRGWVAAIAVALFAVFAGLWFVLPTVYGRELGGKSG